MKNSQSVVSVEAVVMCTGVQRTDVISGSVRKYFVLKMHCHSFVLFMCLWGWRCVIITPGMFFMSNNDFPCILGFLLEAETFNFQSANPNSPFSLRSKNAPTPNYHDMIILLALWAELALWTVIPLLFRVLQYSCQTVIVYRRDHWLNFTFRDNLTLTMWCHQSPSLTCVLPISLTTDFPTNPRQLWISWK